MYTAKLWASATHGWPFKPVFTAGSPPYAEYVRLWQVLRQQVEATRHSRFEARDWH